MVSKNEVFKEFVKNSEPTVLELCDLSEALDVSESIYVLVNKGRITLIAETDDGTELKQTYKREGKKVLKSRSATVREEIRA